MENVDNYGRCGNKFAIQLKICLTFFGGGYTGSSSLEARNQYVLRGLLSIRQRNGGRREKDCLKTTFTTASVEERKETV